LSAFYYAALQWHPMDQRRRRCLVRPAVSGPAKAFAAAWVNELWLADFSFGPLRAAGQNEALAATPASDG
jgi:hypothetical protein